MVLALLTAVVVLLVGRVVVLTDRDRGRERSSRDVPLREAWDVAGSDGSTHVQRQTPGPGA